LLKSGKKERERRRSSSRKEQQKGAEGDAKDASN
jgi:hypothetical protein